MTILTSRRQVDEFVPRLVPLADALPRLGIRRATAYVLIAEDRFPVPVVRVGRRWYVRTVDLDSVCGRR